MIPAGLIIIMHLHGKFGEKSRGTMCGLSSGYWKICWQKMA